MTEPMDDAFLARRASARAELDALPGNYAHDSAGRTVFFDAVYEEAKGDEAAVPWADLEPKDYLIEWLAKSADQVIGQGKSAIDVGCGLGDNAEAMAAHGYATTAFDVVVKAIDWAKKRFPATGVNYQVADLFALPDEWMQSFDLVHECYTLQALPPEMLHETSKAICGLVAPGGKLLIYTRARADGAEANGPPWPIEEQFLDLPKQFGLTKLSEQKLIVPRDVRNIPHHFSIWQRL
ncbi:MAG: class I SAM-dependent methyltransferase [Hyphomicrobiales bacterium]